MGESMKLTGAFDPEETAAMTAAYAKVCELMRDWGQPDAIKDAIAKRIIEAASRGERDPDEICDCALKSLGFVETPSIQPAQHEPTMKREGS
jgi:hypothetical protein